MEKKQKQIQIHRPKPPDEPDERDTEYSTCPEAVEAVKKAAEFLTKTALEPPAHPV